MKLARFFTRFLREFTEGDLLHIHASLGYHVAVLHFEKNAYTATIYREADFVKHGEATKPLWTRDATTLKGLLKEARLAAKVFDT